MVSKGQALKASNCGCISLLEGSTLPTKLADVENVCIKCPRWCVAGYE